MIIRKLTRQKYLIKALYAVLRETNYPSEEAVEDNSNFIKFQAKHAEQPGYAGTVVTHAGDGRYLTITLWDTGENMDAARKALGPVPEDLLPPLLTDTAKLLGTGPVVVNDLCFNVQKEKL